MADTTQIVDVFGDGSGIDLFMMETLSNKDGSITLSKKIGTEQYQTAVFNNGLDFDASTRYETTTGILSSWEGALSLQLSTHSLSGGNQVALLIDENFGTPINIMVNFNSTDIYVDCAGDTRIYYHDDVSEDQFYSLVLSWSITTNSFVVHRDGINVYEETDWQGFNDNGENTTFWGSLFNGNIPLNGILDQVRYFNRPLTPSEALYLVDEVEVIPVWHSFLDISEDIAMVSESFIDVSQDELPTYQTFQDISTDAILITEIFQDLSADYQGHIEIFSDVSINRGDIAWGIFYDISLDDRDATTEPYPATIIKRINE